MASRMRTLPLRKPFSMEAEAALAVTHAEECYRAASELRYLPPDRLAAVTET